MRQERYLVQYVGAQGYSKEGRSFEDLDDAKKYAKEMSKMTNSAYGIWRAVGSYFGDEYDAIDVIDRQRRRQSRLYWKGKIDKNVLEQWETNATRK